MYIVTASVVERVDVVFGAPDLGTAGGRSVLRRERFATRRCRGLFYVDTRVREIIKYRRGVHPHIKSSEAYTNAATAAKQKNVYRRMTASIYAL